MTLLLIGVFIGWLCHALEDGTLRKWWHSYGFIKFRNLFLFPVIVVGCLWRLKDVGYKNFRELAYKKMYKWQWRILDRLMEYKEARK